MKCSPSDKAFPGMEEILQGLRDSTFTYHTGLTKREHFAGLAMQGILSNPVAYDAAIERSIDENRSLAAMVGVHATDYADALIVALNKEV